MKTKLILLCIFSLLLLPGFGCASDSTVSSVQIPWAIHDMNRPQPPVVMPGDGCFAAPPSDAIVLFDGTDLSKWVMKKGGGPAKWKVENGYMEVVKKTGSVLTKQSFGSCQLHVEWFLSQKIKGRGQGRGNSGVFMMGKYEIQIMDSFNNKTYPDGQAASIYGQYPPLVNASRAPDRWQSYDIIWHRPRFDKDGKLLKPATVTVLHNGVLALDNVALTGPSAHKKRPPYSSHPDKLPISLQYHGSLVRFRNIWIRELE